MELIEALADGENAVDVIKRIQAVAPPDSQFLAVTMPPFATHRDQDVIASLKTIGWKLVGANGRTVYLSRNQEDQPNRFGGR